MRVLLTAFNSRFTHSSLALRYLAAACRQAKQEIAVYEPTIQTPLTSVLMEVYRHKPDIIGIAVHIWNRDLSLALAAAVKQVMPAVTVIVGGPEVSYAAEQTLQENSAIDAVIMGEGDELFPMVVGDLTTRGNLVSRPGLAFRISGEIVVNGEPLEVASLDALPFAYADATTGEWKDRILYYETSRGCPFRCAYCLSAVSRSVRRRSLPVVLSELRQIIAMQPKQVKFVDRTFNLDESYFRPILAFLAEQDTDLEFHFELAVERLSESFLDWLTEAPAGRFRFEIGVQTINPVSLEAINRQQDWQITRQRLLRLCAMKNCVTHLDLICCLPHDTEESFAKALDEVYLLGADEVQLGFLKLLPGAPLQQQAAQYGFRYLPNTPPYEVLASATMPYEAVSRFKRMETLFDQFYNAGRFKKTVALLTKAVFHHSVSAFLHALSEWWDAEGLFQVQQNPRVAAEQLWRFIQTLPENIRQSASECLMLDVLSFQQGWRPEFLPWRNAEQEAWAIAFWRDVERVRSFLPDYEPLSWREINRRYAVEWFCAYDPVSGGMKNGCEKPKAVLIDIREQPVKCWWLI